MDHREAGFDITLHTNDPAAVLEWRGVVPEADGYALVGQLTARVRGFAGSVPFQVERIRLEAMMRDLARMDATLAGETSLHGAWQQDGFRLAVIAQGAVDVEGELEEATGGNVWRFRFQTDQTCLRPLLADLRVLLAAYPPAS